MARTRGLIAVLVSAALTLGVTGCSKPGGAEPTPTGSPSVAPAGPLSEAEALDVIAKLTDINNQANAARDSALLATYEDESAFALDDASYIVDRAVDPGDTTPFKKFSYSDPKVFIPLSTEYPQWFLAEATTSKRVVLGFSRAKAGDPWKLVVGVAEAAPLPELAKASSGNATLVGTNDTIGLLRSPIEVATAHAQYQTAGVSAAGTAGALFGGNQPTPVIKDDSNLPSALVFVNTKTATMGPAESYQRFATSQDFPVRALRTADGGAVVVYTITTTITASQTNGITKLKNPEAALAGKTDFTEKITLTGLDQYVVYIPPAAGATTVTVLAHVGGVVRIA